MDGNNRSDLIEWLLEDIDLNVSSGNGIVSPTTGLDSTIGLILEPTVEFVSFIVDSIMSVLSGVMRQEELEFVMVGEENIKNSPGEVGASYTITDMKPYATVSGNIDFIRYPNFSYSPEEIFAGKIDLLDANFIGNSNKDDDWLNIRKVISQWYQVLRMIAIVGMLAVLIYIGIKIIISSTSNDKAKYKEMIANWLIAVILIFTMHYIMAFILSIIEEITSLLQGLAGAVQVNAGGVTFKTNLMGLARFQIQQQHYIAKIGYLIIYIALVVYTFKFTFVYLKRMLKMAFLTLIAPLVAFTYPIDKANDGNAQGFQTWLKEFIYNALLQPMHYILYYILVSSTMTLAVRNPIYAIAALAFISQGEKLLKKIFGFNKAKAGTVGGIAGAFATGAITSSLINHVKNPLHPFSSSKGSGKSGGKSNSRNHNYYNEEGINFYDDTTNEDDLLRLMGISPTNVITHPSKYDFDYLIPELYGKPMVDLADESYRAWELSQDMSLSEEEREYYAQKAHFIHDLWSRKYGSEDAQGLDSSMFYNQFGTGELPENGKQEDDGAWNKFKKVPVVKGLTHVGKNIAKPIWDTEKDASNNMKNLAGNVAKGAVGAGLGIAAATVQAGISITDGKYNPIEGIGTVAAGVTGVASIANNAQSKKEINPEDKKALEKYSTQWFNRDDIINKYENEYPGEGKKRRTRAVKNYVSRGITDLQDQKQAMKFADLIQNERGLDEEEADKIAVATLQYRQNLNKNNNYSILFDEKKKNKYIDVKADTYSGSASKNAIRQLHEELIENVRDFDRANK